MNSTDAILVFIIGQLAWIMYKVGRLEARVRNLEKVLTRFTNDLKGERECRSRQ